VKETNLKRFNETISVVCALNSMWLTRCSNHHDDIQSMVKDPGGLDERCCLVRVASLIDPISQAGKLDVLILASALGECLAVTVTLHLSVQSKAIIATVVPLGRRSV
jgi:hypothetical protein